MYVTRVAPLIIAGLVGFAFPASYGAEIISCNGFESCPTDDGDAIVALEARVAALESSQASVPANGIILWDSSTNCPAGFTVVATAYVGGAALNNYYLRATGGAGAGTVSGDSSVSPAISATSTGTVNTTDLAHSHPVSGTTYGAGTHNHSFTTSLATDIVAAYREGTGAFNITGDHTHMGTTASSGNHSHNLETTTGAASGTMNHAHGVSISTTGSVTVGLAPLGYSVLMCRKS
jgi:hypothetical protein